MGPFNVVKKYSNGSYQLSDLDGSLHSNRVNGFRLKKYVVRIMQLSTCKPVVMEEDTSTESLTEDVLAALQLILASGCQTQMFAALWLG